MESNWGNKAGSVLDHRSLHKSTSTVLLYPLTQLSSGVLSWAQLRFGQISTAHLEHQHQLCVQWRLNQLHQAAPKIDRPYYNKETFLQNTIKQTLIRVNTIYTFCLKKNNKKQAFFAKITLNISLLSILQPKKYLFLHPQIKEAMGRVRQKSGTWTQVTWVFNLMIIK